MTATIGWHAPAAVEEVAVDPDRRPLVVQLYLDRLTRLVQLEVAELPTLSAEEQRRLRTRAVVGAIETLTALGAGSSASDLLRAAQRRCSPAAPCPPRIVLSGDVFPDAELRRMSEGAPS